MAVLKRSEEATTRIKREGQRPSYPRLGAWCTRALDNRASA